MKRALLVTLLLEAALVIAWSSGFIGGKLSADTPGVFLVLFWRFLIASLLLIPFLFQALRRGLSAAQFRRQAIIGFFGMTVYLAAGLKGIELGVPAGLAALIGALQPMATAVLAGPLLGEKVGRRQWFGLLLGFAGVTLAVGGNSGDAPVWAYGLCLLGMASLVGATLYAKARGDTTAMLPTLAIHCIVATPVFLVLTLLEGNLVPPLESDFVFAVGWFIVFSTLGGYGLYWVCLKRTTATRVSSLIYLTPPVTMIWAWAMFGEALSAAGWAGFALCLLGVALANRRRHQGDSLDGAVGIAPASDRSARSP
ncbi:DMT family transporter [Pelagibius litoralis]|uniref:DMT family transporter n=1 Tax=Pelagibius litoralis TaxID=374515 RepID=A0A967EYP0_9PROT|nr:DMT family transporter [Pelagibius litoralis]NIA69865.1 DMT family transporter [Pelagibius litoralis]